MQAPMPKPSSAISITDRAWLSRASSTASSRKLATDRVSPPSRIGFTRPSRRANWPDE